MSPPHRPMPVHRQCPRPRPLSTRQRPRLTHEREWFEMNCTHRGVFTSLSNVQKFRFFSSTFFPLLSVYSEPKSPFLLHMRHVVDERSSITDELSAAASLLLPACPRRQKTRHAIRTIASKRALGTKLVGMRNGEKRLLLHSKRDRYRYWWAVAYLFFSCAQKD